jgi:vanillate O-demethylase monooxygenase subunit
MMLRNAWYIAEWADNLTTTPVARRICNAPIVLYRDARGTAAALADYCCHRSAPLSCGRVVDGGLECGYHGIIYGTDGAAVHIPGQVHIPSKARVPSYPLVEQDGILWIWMGDPTKADATTIFRYPIHDDEMQWPHKHTLYPVSGNAMLMVDNLMDLTHLPYVHESTIGGSNAKDHVEAIMDVVPTDTGLKFTRWMLDHAPPPTYRKGAPHLAATVDRWQEFEFIAPGIVTQWVGAIDAGTGAYDRGKRDGGFSLRIIHGLTPETDTTCHYFWCGANGYRQDDPLATIELFGELSTAFKQDQWIVQQQQARLLEIGEGPLINIVADGARVHMRRIVDRLIAAERAEPQPA